MNVQHVVFEKIETDRWKVRVIIIGEDIEQRALPVIAEVGDEPVEGIMSLPGGSLVGFLKQEPPPGSVLSIGYADHPLQKTTFEFQLLTS